MLLKIIVFWQNAKKSLKDKLERFFSSMGIVIWILKVKFHRFSVRLEVISIWLEFILHMKLISFSYQIQERTKAIKKQFLENPKEFFIALSYRLGILLVIREMINVALIICYELLFFLFCFDCQIFPTFLVLAIIIFIFVILIILIKLMNDHYDE